MTDPILLGAGDSPDVCASNDGWLVAWRVTRGPLRLSWFSPDGASLGDTQDIDTGSTEGGTFPRVVSARGRIWLAYRAFREGLFQAVVRTVLDRTETLLGESIGNNPVCLSLDWVAWQSRTATMGMASDRWAPRIVLWPETRPTGLSRIEGTTVVFIDEDRALIPGMSNPVWAGNAIVGEGPDGGMRVHLGKRRATLLSGDCFVPRCAVRKRNQYAAVTWGGAGVRLLLFTAADLADATTNKRPKK